MSVSLIDGHVDPEEFILSQEARKIIRRFTDYKGYFDLKNYDNLFAALKHFFFEECGIDIFMMKKEVALDTPEYACGLIVFVWTDPDSGFDYESIKWEEHRV